jgi:four helix bundle protein
MDIQDLEIYKSSMLIGDRIWTVVQPWDRFEKDTIGRQMVRAADSVAANLSEGYGRYFFREKRQFCYYARGSLHELRTWLQKSSRSEPYLGIGIRGAEYLGESTWATPQRLHRHHREDIDTTQ